MILPWKRQCHEKKTKLKFESLGDQHERDRNRRLKRHSWKVRRRQETGKKQCPRNWERGKFQEGTNHLCQVQHRDQEE